MKTRNAVIIVVLLVLFALACGPTAWVGTRGSGRMTEKAFTVRNFDGVELATMCHLVIEFGEKEALRIEAEDNLVKYFMAEVRGNMLEIRTQRGVNMRPTRDITCYLTAESLDKIVLSGSGEIDVPDVEVGDNFDVRITGSGDIVMEDVTADVFDVHIGGSGDLSAGKVEAEDFSCSIVGSGKVDVDHVDVGTLDMRIPGSGNITVASGSADSQTVNVLGSGGYRAKGVDSEEAEVRITGSGNATLSVEESLDVHISGSGDVRYIGSPTVETSVTGSGDISQVGK